MGPVPPSHHRIIMELASIKAYQRTIASVELPLRHFIETGFWNPDSIEGWTDSDIGDTFVRRACRTVARELKRPFIQCYATFLTSESYDTGKRSENGRIIYDMRPLPAPRFNYAFVEIPKQKRLAPLAAPLLLLPERYQGNNTAGFTQHRTTLWQAHITSEELWNQYYDFVLNDPECRKARRLT
jgi:hypothetical protein